eukprot:Rhum_TRINITY_DN13775_c0_g2::Rhum_TRINITY_DN13775_c0_g2_i1::g.64080::m.64080
MLILLSSPLPSPFLPSARLEKETPSPAFKRRARRRPLRREMLLLQRLVVRRRHARLLVRACVEVQVQLRLGHTEAKRGAPQLLRGRHVAELGVGGHRSHVQAAARHVLRTPRLLQRHVHTLLHALQPSAAGRRSVRLDGQRERDVVALVAFVLHRPKRRTHLRQQPPRAEHAEVRVVRHALDANEDRRRRLCPVDTPADVAAAAATGGGNERRPRPVLQGAHKALRILHVATLLRRKKHAAKVPVVRPHSAGPHLRQRRHGGGVRRAALDHAGPVGRTHPHAAPPHLRHDGVDLVGTPLPRVEAEEGQEKPMRRPATSPVLLHTTTDAALEQPCLLHLPQEPRKVPLGVLRARTGRGVDEVRVRVAGAGHPTLSHLLPHEEAQPDVARPRHDLQRSLVRQGSDHAAARLKPLQGPTQGSDGETLAAQRLFGLEGTLVPQPFRAQHLGAPPVRPAEHGGGAVASVRQLEVLLRVLRGGGRAVVRREGGAAGTPAQPVFARPHALLEAFADHCCAVVALCITGRRAKKWGGGKENLGRRTRSCCDLEIRLPPFFVDVY